MSASLCIKSENGLIHVSMVTITPRASGPKKESDSYMMKVNEIFTSVQGEGSHAGQLCTFVRFTACHLRCTYCDTEYAFYEGDSRSREDVLQEVLESGVPLVCVTGGEPMLQRELPAFIEGLLDAGRTVLLETSGSKDLSNIPSEVIKVVDVKTPGALMKEGYEGGETSPVFEKTHFHYPNLDTLLPHDEVKFVVTSRADYDWSIRFIEEHGLAEKTQEILMSPSHGQVEAAQLVDWMRESAFPGRLNLQLHKYIWGTEVRGV